METAFPPFAKSRVSPQRCGLLLEAGHGVKFLLVGTDALGSRPRHHGIGLGGSESQSTASVAQPCSTHPRPTHPGSEAAEEPR